VRYTVDFSFEVAVVRSVVRDLKNSSWVRRGDSAILMGAYLVEAGKGRGGCW